MANQLKPFRGWTPSQDRVRAFVLDYRARYGVAPSRRVIHEHTGLRSRSYIDRVVGKMGKRGELAG